MRYAPRVNASRGIPDERYGARLAACREAIADRGFAALLLGVGPDLRYLTGFVGDPTERVALLVVPAWWAIARGSRDDIENNPRTTSLPVSTDRPDGQITKSSQAPFTKIFLFATHPNQSISMTVPSLRRGDS